jgi:hypothetical protein
MSVKDFRKMSNVPIVGQTQPPVVRDALDRELQVGDFVILQVAQSQPFRVTAIRPLAESKPPMMEIVLSSQSQFAAPYNVPNQEFLRVMTNEEVQARIAAPKGLVTP